MAQNITTADSSFPEPSNLEGSSNNNDNSRKEELCANCGSTLGGQFCHTCGQSSKSMIKFFGEVIMELVDDAFGYDSRLKHSIIPLLFKPGRITLDYIRGKRFHYVLPFKLYLITSVLFILLIKNVIDTDKLNIGEIVDNESNQQASQQVEDGINQAIIGLQEAKEETDEQLQKVIQESATNQTLELGSKTDDIDTAIIEPYLAEQNIENQQELSELALEQKKKALAEALADLDDTDVVNLPLEITNEIINDISEENKSSESDSKGFSICSSDENENVNIKWNNKDKRLEGLEKLKDSTCKSFAMGINPKFKEWSDNPKRLIDSIIEQLPFMMFIILPIFAILLKIFYIFSKRYYTEHLVFLLHNHSFIYMVMMLQIGSDLLEEKLRPVEHWAAQSAESTLSLGSLLLSFWMFIYVFLAMKRFYRQGWAVTILKTMALGFAYTVMLVIGFIAAFAAGAYQA